MTVSVTRSVSLDAPADRVWSAVTDLRRWMALEGEVDLRVGGTGRLKLADGERSVLVTELDEGRALRMVWWREEDGEMSTVELALTESETGTAVTVTEQLIVPATATATATATAPRVSMRWGCAFAQLSAVCFAYASVA